MDFFPTGFQYYRAPTPDRRFWEEDLKRMSEQGFNTVKYWVQWRWSERKEGVFDFSDLDELMDLAEKYGLKVVLNLILDVAPVWFTRRYPDADFVSLGGVPHRPMAINCRQIGGVPGPCVHHEKGTFYRERFVEETAKHFRNHPAMYLYDVWNEPNLNFKADRNSFDSVICYCQNSVEEFKNWLRKKYGEIEKLNELWGKCYNDFDEAEPPRCTGMSNEFIDWRLFFVDSTTQDLKMRIRAIKKYDGEHRVMCHTVPYPIFSSVFNTTDDFALAAECDLFGNSVGSNAFAANMLVDSARGKDVINAEVHMVGGHAITGYCEPDCEDIQKHYLLPLARGIKGFLIWQYRPESLGDEAPCWGNVDYLGNDRKWQQDCIALSNIFSENKEVILNQKPRKARVAIFFEPKSEMFTYSMTNRTELFDEAVTGLYNYLYDCNKEIRFIREEDIEAENLDFEAIYMVSAFWFRSSLAKKLEKYVQGGGTLVIEPLTAMHDEDTGRHAPVVPGCGIDVFAGVRQTSCYHKDKLKACEFSDPEKQTFTVQYGGEKLTGKNFRACYQPIFSDSSAAKPAAEFENGNAAIWECDCGKGKVITLGTSLSACYPAKENYGFYKNIGSTEDWKALFPAGVRADLITDGTEGLLVVDNRSAEAFVLNAKDLQADVYSLYEISEGNLRQKKEKTEAAEIPAECVRLFGLTLKSAALKR